MSSLTRQSRKSASSCATRSARLCSRTPSTKQTRDFSATPACHGDVQDPQHRDGPPRRAEPRRARPGRPRPERQRACRATCSTGRSGARTASMLASTTHTIGRAWTGPRSSGCGTRSATTCASPAGPAPTAPRTWATARPRSGARLRACERPNEPLVMSPPLRRADSAATPQHLASRAPAPRPRPRTAPAPLRGARAVS